MAVWFTLNQTWKSKTEIPVKMMAPMLPRSSESAPLLCKGTRACQMAAPVVASARQIPYNNLASGLHPQRTRTLIWTGGSGMVHQHETRGSSMRIYCMAFYLALLALPPWLGTASVLT